MEDAARGFGRYAEAYLRRADAREAERVARAERLRERAREIARALRDAYGDRVRVVLFGSLVDAERFGDRSDIDIGVEGLSPGEYWEAWRRVEPLAGDARLDLVRLESAPGTLRAVIGAEGEELDA